MRHKFNAKRTQVGDRSYASKLEAAYAKKLDSAVATGELIFYLEQIPFKLPGNLIYRIDFMEFWGEQHDKNIIFTEVKGMETPTWKLKYKLFLETYPWIELNIVKKI